MVLVGGQNEYWGMGVFFFFWGGVKGAYGVQPSTPPKKTTRPHIVEVLLLKLGEARAQVGERLLGWGLGFRF